jgi:hypothetical protein
MHCNQIFRYKSLKEAIELADRLDEPYEWPPGSERRVTLEMICTDVKLTQKISDYFDGLGFIPLPKDEFRTVSDGPLDRESAMLYSTAAYGNKLF